MCNAKYDQSMSMNEREVTCMATNKPAARRAAAAAAAGEYRLHVDGDCSLILMLQEIMMS